MCQLIVCSKPVSCLVSHVRYVCHPSSEYEQYQETQEKKLKSQVIIARTLR